MKTQGAVLATDAYVVDEHRCENLIPVNISILCWCVCVYPFLLI